MNSRTKAKDAAINDPASDAKTPQSPSANSRDVNLEITGMSCAGCAGRVEKSVGGLEGVTSVDVNLALNTAHVAFDGDKVDVRRIAQAVADAGYSVAEETWSYDIDGMTCANCAGRVEKALAALPGVTEATVNFALEQASITALPGQMSDDIAIRSVEGAGYHATSRNKSSANDNNDSETAARSDKPVDRSLLLLGASVVLTAPLVLQMVWMYLGVEYHLPAWVELALATPVQFLIGWRFYRGAFAALRHRSANMDVLVALGTSSAYFLSLYNMIVAQSGQSHLYFEASAAIITLILGGKIMEDRAKRGASAAIRELMALRPRRARKIVDGKDIDVAIDELKVGDIVRVLPGERLPVDGIVDAGESELDESLITGETRPVARVGGDEVVGGAVNGTGRIDIKVSAVGDDTTLSRIIRLVEKAQTGKAPVQKLVDRVSAVFVPVVIVIALVTLAGWLFAGFGMEESIVAAVSVLVIACPCALGLATPTALVAGTGSAARAGILIRNFDALEQAHNIDTVIFDKTGTLTEGSPTVRDVKPVDGVDQNDLLRLAAAVQAASEHPLARAVVSIARDKGMDIPDVIEFRGKTGAGVMATVEGKSVVIGTDTMLRDQSVSMPDADAISADISQHEARGRTVILIAIDGKYGGFITLEDRIRESAKQTIADLKARGINSIMLSGDSQEVASYVTEQLGLERGEGRIRPQDKALAVEKLRKEGRHVAMVGDGINDAPALAAADVGIAMGGGTDVAMETAGITLMRSDPALVADAIDISIATRRKIAQNLFWAFAYNVIGVPLAAFGVLSPAIAGAAMALSSVSVVSNSVMLRRWKARGAQK
ncbi:heavy metal translocating P-type ATPase [Thalassospira lohafexi]|uniref:P-type Cu(+) transporter n=1 Tax=Thalassospira lohafexi TaxID=744227 RepID=A0A2N3LA50_9PROT|nr:heavy metal translocating P-type ATPase [Thalassospira lohafexi]PKR59616.1 copper-translocating P-type ATPase [Thalassospira lohafexi]